MLSVAIPELSPRDAFAALAARPDHELDLAEGALLISAEENPNLEPRSHLQKLDRWGKQLRHRLEDDGDSEGDLKKLAILVSFLYGEKELRGNREHYYDPRNSFLDEVLERRLGIPLSLAVVLIEVGRRAGIPLVGVGFPGHFLVRHACHPHLLLDPFDGGNLLTPCDCAELLRRLTRDRIHFSPHLLQTVGPRQILLRMLNNLCGIYLARNEVQRCLSVVERKLLLYPDDVGYLRERGVLRLKVGHCEQGLADLEGYLEARPDAHDWDEIAALAEEVRQRADFVH